jgi:diacylglycerol kinase (ATP)
MDFIKSRLRSFRYAFAGCRYVLRTQHNAWIHAVVSIAVIGVGIWVQLELRDWAVIILTMAVVWTAEFLNTALEAMVDLASPEQHPLAGIGKDVSAAAVMMAAFGAVLVGLLILGPPLWIKVQVWLNALF